MSRPPAAPAPTYTRDDALDAAAKLRTLRAGANDPDLVFFPALGTNEDVASAEEYARKNRRVPVAVLRDEIPYRAILVAYLDQLETENRKTRMLALLTAAHETGARPSGYVKALGLSGRAGAHNRRQRLSKKPQRQSQKTEDSSAAAALWLKRQADALRQLAGDLVDRREDLIALADEAVHDEVMNVIDELGLELGEPPGYGMAGAITYLAYLLPTSDDDDLREVIHRAAAVRVQWLVIRPSGRED